ncbi:MAG: DegT/DnrJ/EryC1/StrS aminotransferase [Gemmatimonadetes bacterium]|nr:DegT/DnrJ/EryC1/StrS aminotransferase [Gemmatimonadota bacterium]
MNVPLLDLTRQHRTIATEVEAAIRPVIDEQRFILGAPVERLEREIEAYLGVPHAVGCASGTDAILLAVRAFGVDRGGEPAEVVTSPFTFFATAGAVHNAGGRPVFADIDPLTFNLDPAAAEAAVTPRTKVVMPVHLFGQMADMPAFRALGDRHGVAVVEDAAQAIGARQKGADGAWITTGTLGDACTFSFFPTKNLGGFGDGGMITARDAAVAARLGKMRVHGGLQMYHHEEVGFNSRLDALQAAVLSAKLPHLQAWSDARRAHAAFYDEALAGIGGLVTPVVPEAGESIYNQYTLRILGGKRDAFLAHLRAAGVGSSVYYPLSLHQQECFAYLGYREGQFPESERAAREVVSIPVFPELTADERAYVAETVRGFFGA